MTTLTSVKYITQQELLDVLPRTMYGEKGNAAPGPQLGHTMPVGLPFWLGVSKPFNLVRLKGKKDRVEFLFISFRLIKPTWQHSGSTLPYNGEMNHYGACQRPNVHCRLYVEEKIEMRFGSATVRLRLDFVYLEASWSPSRRPLFWSSVNWRWEECSLFLRALSWSLCCRVQWTLRKHQWIRHHHPSWDKAGWPLLKLQWPKAWTLLLSIPCPTQPLGIYDLKFIGNHTLAWQLQKQWLALSCF